MTNLVFEGDMARLQQAIAESHDLVVRRNTVLESLNLQTGERVLELGCGGGYYAYEAARFVGPTGRVCAIDISPDQIRAAKARCAEFGWSNAARRISRRRLTEMARLMPSLPCRRSNTWPISASRCCYHCLPAPTSHRVTIGASDERRSDRVRRQHPRKSRPRAWAYLLYGLGRAYGASCRPLCPFARAGDRPRDRDRRTALARLVAGDDEADRDRPQPDARRRAKEVSPR